MDLGSSAARLPSCWPPKAARSWCTVAIQTRRTRLRNQSDGGQASTLLGDLAITEQAEHVCAAAALLGVDVLVNNAGPFSEHTWSDADPTDWANAFQSNVVSAVRMIQALTPAMRHTGWDALEPRSPPTTHLTPSGGWAVLTTSPVRSPTSLARTPTTSTASTSASTAASPAPHDRIRIVIRRRRSYRRITGALLRTGPPHRRATIGLVSPR